MPFGLQTKSLIVGAILGAVVVPRILTAVAGGNRK